MYGCLQSGMMRGRSALAGIYTELLATCLGEDRQYVIRKVWAKVVRNEAGAKRAIAVLFDFEHCLDTGESDSGETIC